MLPAGYEPAVHLPIDPKVGMLLMVVGFLVMSGMQYVPKPECAPQKLVPISLWQMI